MKDEKKYVQVFDSRKVLASQAVLADLIYALQKTFPDNQNEKIVKVLKKALKLFMEGVK